MSSTAPITLVQDFRPPVEEKYPIKTDRLWMQHLNVEDHLEGYHEIRKCPETSKFEPINSEPLTIETSRLRLSNRVRSEANPYVQNFAIFEAPNDEDPPNPGSRQVGSIGIFRFPETFKAVNAEPGEPEVGYGFHPDFFGKGYATEALKGFLKYYWEIREAPHVNVKSLAAHYGVRNIASGRVLEKVGFEFVGVSEERPVVMDGSEMEFKIMRMKRPSSHS